MIIISYNNFRKDIVGAKSDMPLRRSARTPRIAVKRVKQAFPVEKPGTLYNMLNNETGYLKPAFMLTGRERP
jgi:hypothetical protein